MTADTPLHSVAMVGVVVRDGRVLCIQRMDNALWELPAGVLELEETFETGVAREVFEETCVRVRPLYVTGIHKEFGHPKRPVTLIWRCEYLSGTAAPTEESRAVEWLAPGELTTRLRPAHAVRATDALDHDGQRGPRIVYHDGTELLHDDELPSTIF